MTASDLCFMTACELTQRIRGGELSAREVMEAHLAQVEHVNPAVNAIPTYLPDLGRQLAFNADEAQAHGQPCGLLHGLPIAHKDLTDTKNIRTTMGSPLFADNVPTQDALIIERIKAAGALTIGKTNVPEFGAGSQTYNPVFGPTFNPYDISKTCGGSSGGAAVALATGMLPIADGSDMGGSLRNPASFNNVVGFRTAPGRVPAWPKGLGWSPLSVQGPMARTVEDVALMLAAIAGPDPRSPIAICEPGTTFLRPLGRDFHGTKVAWCGNMGDFPVDPRVTAALDAQRPILELLGCETVDAYPDMRDADDIFQVLRAWEFEVGRGDLVTQHPDQVKDTVRWNVECGRRLTGPEVARAESKRTELYHRVRKFMETYEFLVLPVSQVPPFDVTEHWVHEIDGTKMETYIDWMKSCYFISILGLPAISVPCGFTPEGLPIGMQIVGRHQCEFGVLQLAYSFQEETRFWRQHPRIATEA